MNSTRILIDSHIFIWALYESKKLQGGIVTLLNESEIFVSRASLLELTFKHGTGRLNYSPEELRAGIEALSVNVLEISDQHLFRYQQVSMKHKDPFDRLLIAQTLYESMQFVTSDKAILLAYPDVTFDARKTATRG